MVYYGQFYLQLLIVMDKQVYEYISQQTNDPIVERKICAVSGTEFAVFQSDVDFYSKISPTFDGVKFTIPTPTLCPEERQRRRLAWRNERKLYKRTCDATGKQIVTIYAPEKLYTVYDTAFWRWDWRDAMQFGQDIDFKKSFTEQFWTLLTLVPKIGIMNDNGVNSENCAYCQDFAFGKNCYMCSWAWYLENCLYCDTEVVHSKYMVDSMVIGQSEYCYACDSSTKLYKCIYVSNAENSSNCFFSENIKWCNHCIMCDGLSNASYHYKNKPISKDTYDTLVKDIQQNFEKRKNDYMLYKNNEATIKPSMTMVSCTSSFGNALYHAKDCVCVYDAHDPLRSKYVYGCDAAVDSHDITISWWPQRCYDSVTPDNGYNNARCIFTWKSKFCFYCDNCHSCSDCFGCVGLKHKQYCIFNKQYTKDEYEKNVALLIKHMQSTNEWWIFFDPKLCPFSYNETIAQEYFPIKKDQAKDLWFGWMEQEQPINLPEKADSIQWSVLPQTIQEIDDSIIQKIIICNLTQKPFRITKEELQFYRSMNIPIPRIHPDVRHAERLNNKPWRTLHLRHCDKTGEKILSCYPPNTPFQVYSQEAYEKEIYG